MDKVYDTIIIGGGPAGYTAALYSARAGYDTLVAEKLSSGGQMALTGIIDNYPGFEEGVDGFTLGMKMQQSAERFGARTKYTEILSADLTASPKRLVTTDGELYAKNVIIAAGAYPRNLGLEGESDYIGRGIHYCAHCDGRFYKDKEVAVIGGGNSAVTDALYLSRLAKKVYLVHRRNELRAEKIYSDALLKADNVEFLWNSEAESFDTNEQGRISSLRIKDTKGETLRDITLDGIFISIGRKPATDFLRDSGIALDKHGYIIAGEDTRTNIRGVFAVGDIRTKRLRQVVTAVADGAAAVHEIGEEL
ncbi:MAG: thioredoxin-disulfide reductase [Ruminococcaceae bacterium]|nr:thioredoxin-disulfide reductase [Oscillospiraceae bacterium]